jgi:acyl transferase domain-containing protein/phosphopantetheinyl transferase/acyl carrier protein
LCAKTGYDASEIELDFELEADLGVDTVKQAEILAAVRERYGLARDEKFRLADYPRLSDLVDYVARRANERTPTATPKAPAPTPTPAPTLTPPTPNAPPILVDGPPAGFPPVGEAEPAEGGRALPSAADERGLSGRDDAAPPSPIDRADVERALVGVLCAKTGYDASEIELDFELEADLGVDTVKQAEILAAVRERYGLARDEKFRLADYPRLSDLVDYVARRANERTPPATPKAPAPTPTPAPTLTPPTPNAPPILVDGPPAGFPPAGEAEPAEGGRALPSVAAADARSGRDDHVPLPSAADERGLSGRDDRRSDPPGEVLAVAAGTREALVARLADLRVVLGGEEPLERIARRFRDEPALPWRVAFVAATPAEAIDAVDRAVQALATGKGRSLLPNKGIFVHAPEDPVPAGGLALVFPGQGSQWVGMGSELSRRFPVAAATLAEADAVMAPILGRPLSDYLFGQGFGEGGDDPEAALRMTTITQPAVLAVDVAIARVLARHGVRPDRVAGHSLGEYAAAVVAGVLRFGEALRIVAARGREMAAATPEGGDPGWMAAVAAPLDVVETVLGEVEGYVVPANKNSPDQTIVAGASDAVRQAMERFGARGINTVRLPVSHAFHTTVVASASVPLRRVLDRSDVSAPVIPIHSNVDAEVYPGDPDAIRGLLARQVASPVEWIGIVERMAAAGVGTFVEAGPKRALTGFVGRILADRPVLGVAVNLPKRGEVRSLLEGLAALWASGRTIRFDGDDERPRPDRRVERSAEVEVVATPASRPAGPPRSGGTPSDRMPLVVSGTALGLPGVDDPFAPEHFDRLLAGETLFDSIPDTIRLEMAAKGVVRLVKRDAGEPQLAEVSDPDQVIRLAARGRAVDAVVRYGIPEDLDRTLDPTARLALAAALEALRDAGLPLAPMRRATRNGRSVAAGWRLPEPVGRETGVILASAFPGYARFAEALGRSAGSDPFPRSFLLEVLALGHARVAAWIGASGPNLQVNAACASTSLAIAVAEDWIRAGRCRRVLVVGADDVTGDALLPWIGAGFLATGAAATDARPEEAALPFDRRRHGMLLGMGAVGLVIETAEAAAERGVTPLAEIVASRAANSAGHPLRLDPDHVAETVDGLVEEAAGRIGRSRAQIAERCLFMSHETYTPARGGSASAEIAALRRAFGAAAGRVVIANTKGFTGHPMGAGLEDAVALRSLVRREVPPIPNLREPDPELGDLNLSRGGTHEVDYVLRLAAGFGSQVACTLYRRVAGALDGRIDALVHRAWLAAVTGIERPELVVDHRTLRVRSETDDVRDAATAPSASSRTPDAATSIPAPTPPAVAAGARVDFGDRGDGRFRIWGVVEDPLEPCGAPRAFAGVRVVCLVAGPCGGAVVEGLARGGAVVTAMPFVRPDDDGVDLEEALETYLRTAGGTAPFTGCLDLLALDGDDEPGTVHGRARYLFHFARAWQGVHGGDPAGTFFTTVTDHGGGCGLGGTGPRPALAGALAGATKGLAREWPRADVRVVDVESGADAAAVVAAVSASPAADPGPVEIGAGRTPALSRTVAVASPPAIGPESVVVLTGGAGGITAAVGEELARRTRCRLAVLDLVPRPEPGDARIDLDAERRALRSRLEAAGERVTPARLDAALAPRRRAKAAAETLERYRAAGASDVHYESCDLTDGAAVARAVDAIRRRFARIDGVVHGAGAEESRLLADKTAAGFDRVFRGKAEGLLHLWRAVAPHRPSFLCAFTSVAGRFGNAGQIDYCAANEAVARTVAAVRAAGGPTRALAIDWSGWDGVGMAVTGGMRAVLLERGVDLIPPEVGAAAAADLIASGALGEVVVCGRLGAFGTPRFAAADAASPDTSAATEIELDPERQSFLADHRIEGVAVLPGVVGLEWMTHAARRALGAEPGEATDVVFERPVKAFPGRPVAVRVEVERTAGGVDCTLVSRSRAATGRTIETPHFHARFRADPAGLEPLGRLEALDARGPAGDAIYRAFFHERSFRVLGEATRVGETGLVATAVVPPCSDAGAGLGDLAAPRAREAALQAAGLWVLARHGRMALPHGVGRIERSAVAPAGTPLVVRVRGLGTIDEPAAGAVVHRFDVDLIGEDGAPFERLRDLRLIETGRTIDAPLPCVPFAEVPETVEVRLDVLAGAADAVAAACLGPAEASLFRRIDSRKRRTDWLGGRIAAKRLVARFLLETAGEPIPETEIGVAADPLGAPDVRIAGRKDLEKLVPRIAVSHGAGRAVAVTAPRNSGTRVGIDVERIEPRDDAFARHVLTDREAAVAEAAGFNGDGVTLLWTLKEAVTKAVGVGLTVDPREVEITALHDGRATVRLAGDAASRFERIGGSRLAVRYRLDEGVSTAWAVLDVEPTRAPRRPAPRVPLPAGLLAPRRGAA